MKEDIQEKLKTIRGGMKVKEKQKKREKKQGYEGAKKENNTASIHLIRGDLRFKGQLVYPEVEFVVGWVLLFGSGTGLCRRSLQDQFIILCRQDKNREQQIKSR